MITAPSTTVRMPSLMENPVWDARLELVGRAWMLVDHTGNIT
jgi:hypothetical protein